MADFNGGGHIKATFKGNAEFVQKLQNMHKILSRV
jgi:hypothetical protein